MPANSQSTVSQRAHGEGFSGQRFVSEVIEFFPTRDQNCENIAAEIKQRIRGGVEWVAATSVDTILVNIYGKSSS